MVQISKRMATAFDKFLDTDKVLGQRNGPLGFIPLIELRGDNSQQSLTTYEY
jgi:hypothetical protein